MAGSILTGACSIDAAGALETKKRQPPVPFPPGLLATFGAGNGLGDASAVEWNGEPVRSDQARDLREAVKPRASGPM